MRWLPLASLLLAGCHWLFGHSPMLTDSNAPDRSRDQVGRDLPRQDLAKPDLPKTDLPRQDLAKADLPKTDLPRQDLAKADLPKADQAKKDLAKPDLPKKQDLAKADFAPPVLIPVSLDHAPVSPANAISGSGTTSWDHPIGCPGAVLVVGIARFGNSTVSSVSQGGSTMNFGKSHTGAAVGTALYYSLVPQVGTAPILVTGSGTGTIVAGSASFCNANPGTLLTWNPGGAPSTSSISYNPSWPKGYATVDVVATTGTNLTFTPAQHVGLWTYHTAGKAGLGWTSLPGGPSPVGWTGTSSEWSYVHGVLRTK